MRDSRGRAREHAPASAPVVRARVARRGRVAARASRTPACAKPCDFHRSIDRSIDRSRATPSRRFRGVESDRRDRSIAPPSSESRTRRREPSRRDTPATRADDARAASARRRRARASDAREKSDDDDDRRVEATDAREVRGDGDEHCCAWPLHTVTYWSRRVRIDAREATTKKTTTATIDRRMGRERRDIRRGDAL